MNIEYEIIVKKLAYYKNFEPEPRPLLEDVLNAFESAKKPLFLVRAPTGYGKTVISFSLALKSIKDASRFDRVVHVLPLRSIIDDIWITADRTLCFAARKMMGVSEEFMHLYPLNLTTVDTFTWDLLKLNTKKLHLTRRGKSFGYDYLTQATLLTSLIVLDEAHFILEDELMRTPFLAIIKFLMDQGVPLILMTATLSKGYVDLFKLYAEKYSYEIKIFDVGKDDPFVLRESSKNFQFQIKKGDPLDFVEEGRRNLVIVNTVARALGVYERARELGNFDNIILLHGRMTSSHKQRSLDTIKEWMEKDEFLVISTQVVEAGVDISADVLVTDAAPINSLIQRIGRVARYRESEGKITILEGAEGPYDQEKVKKTLASLREIKSFNPRLPWTYQEVVNAVHGESRLDLKPIDESLILELTNLLKNPTKRSHDVLSWIERRIMRGEAFLRDFTIPVIVDDREAVLVTPNFLWDLIQRGLIDVENGEIPRSKAGVYDIAKKIAIGEEITVVYKGEYDEERGLL